MLFPQEMHSQEYYRPRMLYSIWKSRRAEEVQSIQDGSMALRRMMEEGWGGWKAGWRSNGQTLYTLGAGGVGAESLFFFHSFVMHIPSRVT